MVKDLIDRKTKQILAEKFQQELQDEVNLSIFVGEENKEYCDFTLQLSKELNEIAPRINPSVYQIGSDEAVNLGIISSPTILIGWDKGYKVKYTGAPAGYEAEGFIETISLISRGESGLQKASKDKIRKVDKDALIQVFITPDCPYCPRAVLLANRIAIEAKGRITSECVEATENMKLATKFNVSSVPQQVINEDMASISIGVQPEGKFVNDVLSYSSSKYTEIIASEQAKKAEAEKLVDVPTAPINLTDGNFEKAKNKYPLLVIDCWAEWCVPCKMIAPVIEELAKDYQGKITFGRLDVDENQSVAMEYQIMSIPTLLIFKNGKKVGQKVGALPKKVLESELVKYL